MQAEDLNKVQGMQKYKEMKANNLKASKEAFLEEIHDKLNRVGFVLRSACVCGLRAYIGVQV